MARALNNWMSGKFGTSGSIEEVARRKASAAAHRRAASQSDIKEDIARIKADREAKAIQALQDKTETVKHEREINPVFGSW